MIYVGFRGLYTADHSPARFGWLATAFSLALLASAANLPAAAQTPPSQTSPTQTSPPASPPAQQPQPRPAAKPTLESPGGGTPAAVLDDKDVDGILGKEIYSATGDDMGRLVDVLVDQKADVRAAIIDFGGFLGVGSRKIAVDWHALQFWPNGRHDRIVLSLTRDQVRVAPEYKQGEPIVVLGPSSAPPSSPPVNAPAVPAK